jgi:hypothetical protein
MMRHFLQPPRAIAGLSRRMPLPTAQRPLVSLSGFAHALSTAYRRAVRTAKLLPPVAAPAQLHLLAAETALKKPVEILDRWPCPADFLALSTPIGEARFTTDRWLERLGFRPSLSSIWAARSSETDGARAQFFAISGRANLVFSTARF